MGGGESCPKCEQKECPSCPECPKCDNSWSIVDNIKRIPVSGTPFTILKADLTGTYPNDNALKQDILPIMKFAPSLAFLISPDRDYTKSDKLAVIALQTPYKKMKDYLYSDREDYEK